MAEVLASLPEGDLAFCEEFVRSGDPVAACVRANLVDAEFSPEVRARKQLKRPEIQAAIKILESINVPGMDVGLTREALVAQMEYVYLHAIKNKDFRSAIAAKNLQAQLLGMLEQKISITANVRVEDMTTEQLEKLAARGMKTLDLTKDKALNGAETYIDRAIAGAGGTGAAEAKGG